MNGPRVHNYFKWLFLAMAFEVCGCFGEKPVGRLLVVTFFYSLLWLRNVQFTDAI